MADSALIRAQTEWYSEVPRSIRGHAVFGIVLMALSFGGFGAWAFGAPLAAAVIAQGSFVATGQNKIVQHLEGGIIESIQVAEGDEVSAGQVLMTLDQTAARATARELYLRLARLEAIEARLIAQYEVQDTLVFPPHLVSDRDDGEIASILDGQMLAFRVAKAALENDMRLLRRDVEALQIRGSGYGSQVASFEAQLELLRADRDDKARLVEQGLARRAELSALERAIIEVEGQLGRLKAEIDEIAEVRGKYREQMSTALYQHRQTALDELQAIQAELDAVRERMRTAEDVAARVNVVSPVDGVVVRFYYHTTGGVVETGKPIAEILPADAPLIVETLIPRDDIDNLHRGQRATVRLTALNRRTTPVLEGEVFYLSADSVTDRGAEGVREVYVARVQLSRDELARVPDFTPTPGMAAEVMIQTQTRTFMQYLVKPIVDSMSRAFREE